MVIVSFFISKPLLSLHESNLLLRIHQIIEEAHHFIWDLGIQSCLTYLLCLSRDCTEDFP